MSTQQPKDFVPFQTKLTPHDRLRIKEAMRQHAGGKGKPQNNDTLIMAWVNGKGND